jgi:hypothetical protein
MKQITRISLFTFILLSASAAQAVTLTFENFAPAGSLVNINPDVPYTEAGFTISVTNALSAVFDSAATVDMPGNLTDFFGFDGTNTPTLTFSGGTFDLGSLLIGPIVPAGIPPINMTIIGTLVGGGTLTATFTGLTTATTANLNWVGLQSVHFNNTSAGGLDNIVVNPSAAVPEVESLTLLALGLFSIVVAGTRHRGNQA